MGSLALKDQTLTRIQKITIRSIIFEYLQ